MKSYHKTCFLACGWIEFIPANHKKLCYILNLTQEIGFQYVQSKYLRADRWGNRRTEGVIKRLFG